MFWEVSNTTMINFRAELQKKIAIDDLENYEITANDTELIDQEDFCAAVLKHLRVSRFGVEPLKVEVIRKQQI
ncbi:unnamed protein product [Mucor hiemalis]